MNRTTTVGAENLRAIEVAAAATTPVAVRDDAAMARNLARMAAVADRAGVALRPHAKTHKATGVAARQLAAGATGLTVATLHEAEVFAAAGVDDLLIAHPPADAVKQRRLAALAASARRLAVSIESLDLAAAIDPRVEVMWEVDSGLHRLGTPPGAATVAAVEALVRSIGEARFRGLMTHGGHAYRSTTTAERHAAAAEEAAALVDTAEQLRARGIEVPVVSVGSTPTAEFVGDFAGVTEFRPGTYVYGDAGQVMLGSHALDDCAVVVVALVIGTPAPERAVLDCGSKSISADRIVPKLEGYGIVLGHPELRIERLSEEHAVVTAPGGETGLRVGQRVAVVPAHVCTTVNLHSELLCFDDDRVYREAVDARGWAPT